jgi:hypothetical protein
MTKTNSKINIQADVNNTAYCQCQMLNRGFAILRCCYVRFAVLTH